MVSSGDGSTIHLLRLEVFDVEGGFRIVVGVFAVPEDPEAQRKGEEQESPGDQVLSQIGCLELAGFG